MRGECVGVCGRGVWREGVCRGVWRGVCRVCVEGVCAEWCTRECVGKETEGVYRGGCVGVCVERGVGEWEQGKCRVCAEGVCGGGVECVGCCRGPCGLLVGEGECIGLCVEKVSV